MDDLQALSRRVLDEIDNYVYPNISGTVGRPWTAERVDKELREFRSALVEPYWADILRRDTYEQTFSASPPRVDRCAVVADDRKGTLLAFDPAASEFILVTTNKNGALQSFGVNGDAVGCFMAR